MHKPNMPIALNEFDYYYYEVSFCFHLEASVDEVLDCINNFNGNMAKYKLVQQELNGNLQKADKKLVLSGYVRRNVAFQFLKAIYKLSDGQKFQIDQDFWDIDKSRNIDIKEMEHEFLEFDMASFFGSQ